MLFRSLSARLLVLTVFFVMLSEVLIFVPSVARYRMTYFDNHLAAGHLASLALAASPTGKLDQPMTNLLLRDVGNLLVEVGTDADDPILHLLGKERQNVVEALRSTQTSLPNDDC